MEFMFFLLLPEELTVAPPYEETWYDDYDEYGMSMKIRSLFLDPTLWEVFTDLVFPKGRKEDETDEKWIAKERERAQKEREREERGTKTQMSTLA